MKKQWTLPTEDGFLIHGQLDQPADGPSRKAVLIVHGMTGSPEELQHEAAAVHFSALGYDVIRPYLYCMENKKERSRRFQDATLARHAADINIILQEFRNSYSEFYAAGHSYGGPSLLMADTSAFSAISLWDPTFKHKTQLSTSFVQDKNGSYIIEWDHTIKVGQNMIDENAALTRADCITLAENCQTPIQVIFAGDGGYVKQGESYHTFTKTLNDMQVVAGTTHCFTEDGTTAPLLQHTQHWFEKFNLS